ncbi:beta-ketoacyl-ACP synthase III [Simkania negevensis]|uniref:Beta-ketoacyl-[acyl-carrier-protein] synthase III n=1 Tax=Simkania negevensis (strain ATCC VR-1471 / DSM 27360 / Z) TaxID=331113 RepID=F8L7G6_SIMNZ|nr:beta-ketoacyl-ACP synthase III [Simkania negevensis]CCB88699.1 3-oxoacyl-[acyl-carrier-protein] synthase 3 [Simkania negevensis Z]
MGCKAKIVGLGSYLPEKVLSNQDLEKMVDTSDEWITTRTGMKERRIARKDESTSDMGYEAALKAVEASKIDPKEIDLILFATHTPDYFFPSTACILQGRLGATHAAALDVQAACTGFIYVLSMAKAYVETGMYKTILVVAADKLSSIVDYTDRNTCVLFGDGASACVVKDAKEGFTIESVTLGADGEQSELIKLPAGGSKCPSTQETVSQGLHYLQMEGKEVFKHAVRRMESAVKTCLEKTGLEQQGISWLVPHQANIRIIESLAKRFEVPKERVFLTIHKYGNTSASSVGIAFDELIREKDVKRGEHIVLFAFGAGLTWGAAAITCEVGK